MHGLYGMITHIYLQVGIKSCPATLKCYVGTILGSPSETEINNLTDPINIKLIKGWINDKIQVDWALNLKMKHSSITYEGGNNFYLPERIKVPLSHKLLSRHLFAKKQCKIISLVMVYGNEMIIKGLKVNKTYSTPNDDVESGLATISSTLKLLQAMPSTSKEGGETSENDDENEILSRSKW